ncbi:hypothetical protein AAON49_07490 [Pseudotenacibaculum sp. MALMAid0570]|uniref:hypothetical protein n=1 Tax=Pseudotenacibaculum sp. MALMAid0570 TaxID=3143938 RepID=UPI0032DF4EA8
MKKLIYTLSLLFVGLITIAAISKDKDSLTKDFISGNPGIASINSLSFGPEGILFIGDSDNAAIYAIDTKDHQLKEKAEQIAVEDFDVKVAAALGTTPKNIRITDMAVNPASKTAYFSVHTREGKPVLLKLINGKLENVSLTDVSYSETSLNNAVAKDAKDRRGRALRRWAISDMKYHKGKIMVSGLSNKEFSSSFRSIPFPFTAKEDFATLEIYHAAHGRYETYAPIKTFDVVSINKKDYLLASYTCTPLVLFPISQLTGGKHLKGRTIAELGSGNSPLDIISFQKGKEVKFYMSNNNRPVMRMNLSDISKFEGSLTEPVKEFGKDVGLTYDNLPFVNVQQLDNLDNDNVLILRRRNDGNLYLHSRNKKWM